MERRETPRLSLARVLGEGITLGDLRVELELDPPVTGTVLDISPSGIGYELDAIDPLQVAVLDQADTVYVKLVTPLGNVIAVTKPAWSRLLGDGDVVMLKGGLDFTVVAPEDRQKLEAIIKGIRSSGSGQT